MSKYHNQKVTYDGYSFDSKAECNRYIELKVLQKIGEIRDLKLQPKFLILDGFKKNGKTYRATHYIADFAYWDIRKDKLVVEDVKGKETEIFRLKQKMFEKRYPDLELTIVKM